MPAQFAHTVDAQAPLEEEEIQDWSTNDKATRGVRTVERPNVFLALLVEDLSGDAHVLAFHDH